MTVFWRWFTAEQDCGKSEQGTINSVCDLPQFHQFEELLFVVFPGTSVFFVGIQQILCRREKWFMSVLGTTDLFQKILEIFSDRKSVV